MAMHRIPDLFGVWGRNVPVVYMRLNGTSPFGRHYLPYLSMPSEHFSSEADAVAPACLLDWVGISGSTEPGRGMISVRSRSAVLVLTPGLALCPQVDVIHLHLFGTRDSRPISV